MTSSTPYKKIVFITSRFPYPLEKGDKLRAYFQIRELSNHFDVHLICLSEIPLSNDSINSVQKFTKSLHVFPLPKWKKWMGAACAFFGNMPIQIGYFHQSSIQRKINTLLNEIQPDHIFCQLIRVAEYVKDYHDCLKTLDYMDTLSKGIERRIHRVNWYQRAFFKLEFTRLRRYENSIFDYFEHHTIISEQDREHIPHPKRKEILIVQNGVSELFFEPFQNHKKYTLVFTGNMSYPPNIEAAKFIHDKILPHLDEQHNVLISGASPVRELTQLSSNRLTISGWIDDIRSSYSAGKIFIAPMFLGTGLQNKLLEAMAMGIPCITTSLANNALGAEPEETILIANNPEEFIFQIRRLLSSEVLYQNISRNGKIFVSEKFTWKGCTQPLIELIHRS